MRLIPSLALLMALGACRTAAPSDVKSTIPIQADKKLSLLAQGHVLAEKENPVMRFKPSDIIQGPLDTTFTRRTGEVGHLPLPAAIACTFVEPDPKEPIGGKSRKFDCADEKGKVYKVKYGVDNPEVYFEVLVSRFFWILGFYADRNYTVQVTCKDCPTEPWPYIQKAYALHEKGQSEAAIRSALKHEKRRAVTVYDEAVIEVKTGDKLEIAATEDAGWGFDQLRPLSLPDDYLCETGKCERIYREALIILASFIMHMDNKGDNQKMFCVEDQTKGKTVCPRDQIGLMIHDGGASFLGYQFDILGRIVEVPPRTELELWRKYKVWRDDRPCQIGIPTTPFGIGSDQSLVRATVSEDARRFLAERLQTVSQEQIYALLQASRLDRRREPNASAASKENIAYTRDFIAGFMDKIKTIVSTTCPYRLETNPARYPQ